MNIYCLKDKLVEEYGSTFEAANDAVAIRQVSQMFSRNPVSVPKDTELYFLGEYDFNTGTITASPGPRKISVDFGVLENEKLKGGKQHETR